MIRKGLKSLLIAKGVKNVDLHKKGLIKESHISDFFKGTKSISIKKLEGIVEYLNCEILFREKGGTNNEAEDVNKVKDLPKVKYLSKEQEIAEEKKILEKKIRGLLDQFEEKHEVHVDNMDVTDVSVKLYTHKGAIGTGLLKKKKIDY